MRDNKSNAQSNFRQDVKNKQYNQQSAKIVCLRYFEADIIFI